jgi:cysteinyl-tRNA synthetase
MHAGMVQMGSEKMSKSIGNIVLAKDAIDALGGEQVRYWCLMASYRSQSLFSDEALSDASQAYERWRTFLHAARHGLGDDMPQVRVARRPVDSEIEDPYVQRFVEAMDDDFNSAEAFAAIHDLVRDANKRLDGTQRGDDADRDALIPLASTFVELTSVLGFEFGREETSSELTGDLIDYLLDLREQARAEGAFERADAIRAKLAEIGVTVEDTPAGPRWHLGGSAPQ